MEGFSNLMLLSHILWRSVPVGRSRCSCQPTISVVSSIFNAETNGRIQSRAKSLQVFKELQTCIMKDNELKADSKFAFVFAFEAVLTSRTFQDTLNNLAHLRFQIIGSDQTGLSMRAAVARDDYFTGREKELDDIVKAVEMVAENTAYEARRVVVVHGNPGLGKSLLATQALRKFQNKIAERMVHCDVCIEIIRGRGDFVVVEDLVSLGRSLGEKIGVAICSPQDVILAALQRFLEKNRYVLVIDDADYEGLSHALHYLPVSKQRCALIVTSQSLTDKDVLDILIDGESNAIYYKKLEIFLESDCMMLLKKICQNCYALLQQEILRPIFKKLGFLPLAVRLFAVWCEKQFNEKMKPHEDSIKLACQAAIEAAGDLNSDQKKLVRAKARADYTVNTGHGSAAVVALLLKWNSTMSDIVLEPDAKYSKGLIGTVRLALLQLQSLDDPNMREACKQLLGLLALCPPDQIPWSLFDGGAKREARMFVRGARARVVGREGHGTFSLEFVSPIGEHCRYCKTVSGLEAPKHLHAQVVSDKVENETIKIKFFDDGKEEYVPTSTLTFGPHVRGNLQVNGHKYTIRLQTPVPARGIHVILNDMEDDSLNGKLARINSHFMSTKMTDVKAAKSTFSASILGEDSRNIKLKTNDIERLMKQFALDVTIVHGQLMYPAKLLTPERFDSAKCRIMQYHAGDDTVSVIFGCDSGKRHPCCSIA
jgi:hypothetical protein